MADFFDKIVSGVSKGVENAKTGSKNLVERAKINTAIEKLDKEKAKLAELMGAKVYNLYKENKLKDIKPEIENFCLEIENRINLIREETDKLANLGSETTVVGAKTCPRCESTNADGSKFCAKCGATL